MILCSVIGSEKTRTRQISAGFLANEIAFSSATLVYTYKKCNLCMAHALFRNMSHVKEIERNTYCGGRYIYML